MPAWPGVSQAWLWDDGTGSKVLSSGTGRRGDEVSRTIKISLMVGLVVGVVVAVVGQFLDLSPGVRGGISGGVAGAASVWAIQFAGKGDGGATEA